MMRRHVIEHRLRTAGALAAAMLACAPRLASAQPADQFFKGKVINLYIGFAAGGSYDYYARLVARFIGKNIPGNPTVVAQTMAGAGSFQAANFLFAAAPRDGTAMGIITQTLAIEDALHSPAVHYKASEFTWIGRATAILEVALTGQTAKAKTIDDARRYETPVAGTPARRRRVIRNCSMRWPALDSRSSPATAALPRVCWRWSGARWMAHLPHGTL